VPSRSALYGTDPSELGLYGLLVFSGLGGPSLQIFKKELGFSTSSQIQTMDSGWALLRAYCRIKKTVLCKVIIPELHEFRCCESKQSFARKTVSTVSKFCIHYVLLRFIVSHVVLNSQRACAFKNLTKMSFSQIRRFI